MRCVRWKSVRIGHRSYFAGPPTLLWDKFGHYLVVGNYTSIAEGLTVFLGGQHYVRRVTTFPLTRSHTVSSYSRGDVVIGSDCWVGNGVTILDGVNIGNGAVIGARSVVAKNVPPYAVAVGNPARVVHYRFDNQTIQRLLAVAWWDWDSTRIEEARTLLEAEDPHAFLAFAERGQIR